MNIPVFFSSKRFQQIAFVIILLGIVVTLALLIPKNMKSKKPGDGLIDVVLLDQESNSRSEDQDSDGVPDWEERLWGLDPNKYDSDNDGVSDGAYVRQRKDELNRTNQSLLGISEDAYTPTQKLSRSLYTALLAIEQTGGTFDTETQDQISDNIVTYIETLPLGSTFFLRENLSIVDNSKENIYQYRDEITGLLNEYPIESNDITILAQALENGTAAYRTKLETIWLKYQALTDKLSTMKVPSLIAGRHTELLNSVASLSAGFGNLTSDEQDELVTISLVSQMENILNQVSEASTYLSRFFTIVEDESVFSD